MRHIRSLVACFLFLASTSMVLDYAAAQDKPAAESAADAAIRDFIMRNPKVIRDALANAEIAEQADRTKRILREQSDAIYRSGSPTLGTTDAKISIVEFFDYNCPYCRKTHPQLLQFLEANPDVRIVLKDIGNLGKDSEAISRLTIAARKQSKYAPFHEAVTRRQRRSTHRRAMIELV